MPHPTGDPAKRVRHFRQILVWPLQLAPLPPGTALRTHWSAMRVAVDDHPWREVADEFDVDPARFQERHYSEFVTFLPYVRRFLYGEGKPAPRVDTAEAHANESPIRVFRRTDIAQVRVRFDADTTRVFEIAHVDLYFFFDIDVVIPVVEIHADDLTLDEAENTMYRFGRAFPNFWDAEGHGGHCVESAEWLAADGTVLATSDFEQREKYLSHVCLHRAPRFASHWDFLLRPLVAEHSDAPGLLRYQQVEYARMPLLAYLAMEDARSLTRADFVRLGLVTAPGGSTDLPYSERHVRDFEDRYCYDQFWNDQRAEHPGTRLMNCGHAFVMVGDASDPYFVDRNFGLLGQFRHQYFLLFLIPHFNKATLLMLSDRMADALNRLDVTDIETVKEFKIVIRGLLEVFLRFTHRYWFHEVSDQPQARDLYKMTIGFLATDALYAEVRESIEGMSSYLDSDSLRRQANTVVRLTVVTIFGLIGTVATGFLGMNVFALAELSALDRIAIFFAVLIPTALLTFYSIRKAKRLSDFLEALSDERIPTKAVLRAMRDVLSRSR
jgi:CorA-like Mg2+ transporter protein